MTVEPPPFELTMAREAYETAAHLHGEATRRGAPGLERKDYKLLREADERYVAAVRDGRIQDAIAADEAFHGVLLDAAGDPDLRVSVDLLAPRLRRMDAWLVAQRVLEGGGSTHPAIIEALEAGDAEQAADRVERSFLRAGEALAAALPGGAGR